MTRLIAKNWSEFQHYKDRSPPWIKLHKKLLDDRHYMSLPLASRALAPMLWLLASESTDGSIDSDHEELAYRLRTNVREIAAGLTPLINKGFFSVMQPASGLLAECGQVAVPETEKRREETEGETKPAAPSFVLPEWIPEDTWLAYCAVRKGKKAKNEPHALGLIVKDLEKFRAAGHDPVEILNNSIKSAWVGVFEPKARDRNAAAPVSVVWHESAQGVIQKAVDLGLKPRDEVMETFPVFKDRVLDAVERRGVPA
jgi:hypothetical protein